MQAFLRFLTASRRAWIRLVAALAVGILCLGLAAWQWYQARTWPDRILAPLPDPLANLDQLGVNADLAQYDPGQLDAVLAQVQEAGFRWIRQRFPWNEIEQQPGTFDWAPWDAIVAACSAHDLRLIAVLDGSPPWARPAAAEGTPLAPPAEVDDWGTFAARFAGRYGGQVDVYQLWDEPNLAAHWGDRYVDPLAYTALLREGAIRVREADPGAIILLAALAPTVEHGPLNLDEADFVQGVLDAGGRPFFDVVALQPYGFGDSPAASASPTRLSFRRIALVRRALAGMGLDGCPVWATAWGWNARPANGEGQPGTWPTVSPAQQASYTLDAIRLARREWPWMGPLILYTLQPDAPAGDPRWGFALLDAAASPTPLYTALARYQAAPQPLYTGIYVARPDNARYTGPWRFAEAGADPPHGAAAAARNAVLEFDFEGTALDLAVRRGSYWAALYVSVDGHPANGLPRDEAGQAYLVLYDPQGQAETVNVARGLAAGVAHHVEIVAHGGWGQWPLAGWTVRQEQVPPPGLASYGLLLLLGAGLVVAGAGQILSAPALHQPLYASIERVFRWYRGLPEWMPILATLGTALAFYASPWSALSSLFLASWLVLAFLRIDLGLATVALALPFYLRPKLLFGRPFSVVELGVWLCAVAWLAARLLDWGRAAIRAGPRPLYWRLQQASEWLRQLPQRIWRERSSPADKGMAALLLAAALALTWSARHDVAAREFRTLFLESALFYALVRLAVRSPRARRRVVEGWLLGATAISLIAIGQGIAEQNLIMAEGVQRVRGFYGSPNNLALYLERALPLLLAVAWQGTGRWRRLAYGAAALPVLAGLILTLSKGALLLGLPAALLTLGIATGRRRSLWVALGGLAVVVLLLLPFASSERFHSLLDPGSGTAFFRLKLWRSTLAMIADHPLTGVGLDQFLYAYRTRYVLPSAQGELNLSHPHDIVLDVWTRLGIPGLLAIGWLWASFFRAAQQELRTAAGDRRALAVGLVAAMAATLAHGLVDQALFSVDLAFVFALVLAIA